MQSSDSYKALPAKVSQQILMLLDKNWTAFFEARKACEEDPSTFTGRPRLPKYKHKTEGRNILVVNGRRIKVWNQWYNKRMKQLKGTIVIGKNLLWKQETGMGNAHARFIDMP